MRGLIYMIAILGAAILSGGCAPELCPGQVKGQIFRYGITTNARANERKAKPSLIHVSRSTNKHKSQVIYSARSTSKRKPPK